MGEFPLDPSQVTPPHEKPAEEMLPAGEVPGITTDDQAHLGEVAFSDAVQGSETTHAAEEPVHLDSTSHDENAGRGETSHTPNPKVYERAHSQLAVPSGIKFPRKTAFQAANEDIMVARERLGETGSPVETHVLAREKLKDRIDNINRRNQILRYSNAIVEHYGERGDTPSLSLKALAAVHELVLDSEQEGFSTGHDDDYLARRDGVNVVLEGELVAVNSGSIYNESGKEEKFWLSMFQGASYEVTELSTDTEGFDEAHITRYRELTQKDVDRLEEVLAPAIAKQAEQDRLDEEHDRGILADNDEQDRFEEDDDDHVSSSEVAARARAHFGDTEEAREAVQQYPGDFI